MITTTDEIADALKRNLSTLTADLAAWTKLSKEKAWESHGSQIARLDGIVAGFATEIGKQIETMPAADVDVARAAGARINLKILQTHVFWDYFRRKLAARSEKNQHRYLRAADEFAWRCYKPCLQARERGVQNGEAPGLASKSPPLIFLDSRESPFVLARDEANKIESIRDPMFIGILAKAPLTVMGLPYYQTADLPSALVIGHEMGHVVEFDMDLREALDREVRDIGLPPEQQDYWLKVRVEAFADAFGTLAGGCAFVPVLAKFIAKEKAWVTSQTYPAEPLRYEYIPPFTCGSYCVTRCCSSRMATSSPSTQRTS